MDNGSCSISKTECKKGGLKCIIPFAAVFATIFAFEWLFHGVFMTDQYLATASQWRTPEEMEKLWPICLLSKFVLSAVICCLYCWVAKGCSSQGKCYHKGAKFGFKIGLLLGVPAASSYMWMPIPGEMAISWLVGNTVMGVLVGLVLAATCRLGKKEG